MRTRYETTFKQQAVELAESLGNVKEAARQLGVSDMSIHEWRQKYGKSRSKDCGIKLQESEIEELKRLRHENAQLKKVNHILKGAAAFFSQDHLK